MCVEALLKNAFRHVQVLVHSTRHKADRLVTGALELLFLAFCMCLSPLSGRILTALLTRRCCTHSNRNLQFLLISGNCMTEGTRLLCTQKSERTMLQINVQH